RAFDVEPVISRLAHTVAPQDGVPSFGVNCDPVSITRGPVAGPAYLVAFDEIAGSAGYDDANVGSVSERVVHEPDAMGVEQPQPDLLVGAVPGAVPHQAPRGVEERDAVEMVARRRDALQTVLPHRVEGDAAPELADRAVHHPDAVMPFVDHAGVAEF